MLRRSFFGTFLLLFLLRPQPAAGDSWYVRPDGSGDAPTIQAAIDSASAGDTVEVACGIYHEHDIRMRSGLTLCSANRDAGCATIDAGGRGRCFHCVGLDSATAIVGFTMTGGVARGAGDDCNGGAMFCRHSCHRIANCAFVDNHAECRGGGVYCRDSSPLLSGCVFDGNVDSDDSRGLHGDRSSSPRIHGCHFGEAAGEEETGSGRHGGGKHHGHHHGH
jgi:hypothetical protein